MIGAHPFSLLQFITDPLKSFSFLCLIITILSFWTYRRFWIWGPLLAFACVCAYFSQLFDLPFLIPVIALFLAYLILNIDLPSLAKLLVILMIILLSVGFSFHLFPDIHNWLLADSLQLSPGAPAFTYYWNFDKPFVGLFALGFRLKLLSKKEEIKAILNKTLALSFSLIILFLIGSLVLNVVNFDFKLPLLTPAWLIGNLFFTVIPEEVFFRGFLQTELTKAIPNKSAPYIANFIISIVFAIAHILFVAQPAYILLAFFASFAYGFIYHVTKSIESAIFAHYLLNLVHFLFFTYPILQ